MCDILMYHSFIFVIPEQCEVLLQGFNHLLTYRSLSVTLQCHSFIYLFTRLHNMSDVTARLCVFSSLSATLNHEHVNSSSVRFLRTW